MSLFKIFSHHRFRAVGSYLRSKKSAISYAKELLAEGRAKAVRVTFTAKKGYRVYKR